MSVRAVIAEDEPLLAEYLKGLLARLWPELEVRGIAANGDEALALLERERPDVTFLDIRMPGLGGLEVAEEIVDRLGAEERAPAIVFVTAYDEFAVRAFELAAADYVLKPVVEERLARTIERLKARLAAPPAAQDLVAQLRSVLQGTHKAGTPLTVLRAGSGNTVKMIPINDVRYFKATDKYTAVVTADGESLIRLALRDLLPQLPEGRFAQVHRGTIVNLAAVEAAVRDDSGRISLRLHGRKETIPVSRIYAELFRQM
ncbi:MAG: LytR/AlgR family response regulator transcription factor [Clostridia bacterium]